MMKIKMVFMAAALTALASTAASAITIDFGQQNTAQTPSIAMSSGGVSLTISARTVDEDGVTDLGPADVVQFSNPFGSGNGLGVVSQPNDTNQYIDGGNDNLNDLLLLTFTAPIKMTAIAFSGADIHPTGGPDFVELFVDGVSMGNMAIGLSGLLSLPDWVGTSFGFAALNSTDEFLVRGVQVTPVPIPAAGLLFAGGIAGIAALGRRKQLTAR
jgi:hypothetical protein